MILFLKFLLKTLKGKYYENTILIQYGTDIIEAMDEAKRLRCEWFEGKYIAIC